MSKKQNLQLLRDMRKDILAGMFGTKNRSVMILRVDKLIEQAK